MDTMEITKFVGAFCASLLVLLLIQAGTGALFDTHAEEVAYLIEVPEDDAGGDAEPEESVDVAALVAEADPASGEGVFRKCAACHKLDGTDGVGPHLDGVAGRDIGAIDGFAYSDALTSMDGEWTDEALDHFLADPKGFAPGTKMTFAGLPNQQERVDLIAYLASLGN